MENEIMKRGKYTESNYWRKSIQYRRQSGCFKVFNFLAARFIKFHTSFGKADFSSVLIDEAHFRRYGF